MISVDGWTAMFLCLAWLPFQYTSLFGPLCGLLSPTESALGLQNIETKARVSGLDRVRALALELGASDRGTFDDTDTYFRVAHGRLKLRVTRGTPGGSLIAYRRPDQLESRISDYRLVAVSDADALREVLAETLGVLATVRKSRHLLIYGATRIHLDEVEGLGTFIELETVIDNQNRDAAGAEHLFLRDWLELDQNEIVPVSYSDLLMKQNG